MNLFAFPFSYILLDRLSLRRVAAEGRMCISQDAVAKRLEEARGKESKTEGEKERGRNPGSLRTFALSLGKPTPARTLSLGAPRLLLLQDGLASSRAQLGGREKQPGHARQFCRSGAPYWRVARYWGIGIGMGITPSCGYGRDSTCFVKKSTLRRSAGTHCCGSRGLGPVLLRLAMVEGTPLRLATFAYTIVLLRGQKRL